MQSGSDIRDVIGNLREDILSLKLRVGQLQSSYELLERFTWNMVVLMHNGAEVSILVDPEFSVPQNQEEVNHDDPTLF